MEKNRIVLRVLAAICLLLVITSCKNSTSGIDIVTEDASNIGAYKATLNAKVTFKKDIAIKDVYFLVVMTESIKQRIKREDLRLFGSKFFPNVADCSSSTSSKHRQCTYSCESFLGLKDGASYSYALCIEKHNNSLIIGNVVSFSTNKLPEGAVDMGLSVMWHKNNLGANHLGSCGNYYAWGETYSKKRYTPNTYVYLDHSKLEPIEDVASKTLGETWRMPTKKECQELMFSKDIAYVGDTILNGVRNIILQSTNTGGALFIPQAGYYYDDELFDKDSVANFWTSEAQYHSAFYYELQVISDSTNTLYSIIDDQSPYYGLQVRPVR